MRTAIANKNYINTRQLKEIKNENLQKLNKKLNKNGN